MHSSITQDQKPDHFDDLTWQLHGLLDGIGDADLTLIYRSIFGDNQREPSVLSPLTRNTRELTREIRTFIQGADIHNVILLYKSLCKDGWANPRDFPLSRHNAESHVKYAILRTISTEIRIQGHAAVPVLSQPHAP